MTARALVTSIALLAASVAPAAAAATGGPVSVRETDGEYLVVARFTVAEPAAVVRAVLTDYANIPRFMPDVQKSTVVEREGTRVRVEQEAVSKYMMFPKRIQLLLDVEEGADVLRFSDTCKRSFERYDGSWTISPAGAETEVTYELSARPLFSVPAFVLRKLLDRNAHAMIAGLRSEIRDRAISP